MVIVQEHYLVKCLDSGVYQSVLHVKIGDDFEIRYTNDTRLWSEHFIDELRRVETVKARAYVMQQIRMRLFQER